VEKVEENGNVIVKFGDSRIEFQRQAIVSKVDG